MDRKSRYYEILGTGLESFRSTVLAKITSLTVLFTFNFVFYFSPAALAVTEDFNKEKEQEAAVLALLESTPEAKLSHRLTKLKEAVLYEAAKEVEADKAPQNFLMRTWSNITSNGPISSDSVAELERLSGEVEVAYEEAIEKLKREIEDSAAQSSTMSSAAMALIKERQSQALQQVESQYQQLTLLLKDLSAARSEETQVRAFQALTDFLQDAQFKATHTPATPDNLPWRTPSPDVRAPIEEAQALTTLLSEAEAEAQTVVDEPQMAAHSVLSTDHVTPELAESVEVVLTPEIRALAAELNHSSIEIYTWVHNNIHFIPSYGSIQGAQQTLDLKQGNAMDTASLLIALLRASDIPARYAYGTVEIPAEQVMNWVGGAEKPEAAQTILGMGGIPTVAITQGGKIVSFKLEHVWTEAWVDFNPSRGVIELTGDSWVPMDASFKQYEFKSGHNVSQALPNGFAEVNTVLGQALTDESGNWIQNIPTSALEEVISSYENTIGEYLESEQQSTSLTLAIGENLIQEIVPRPLSAGLPYKQILTQQTMAEVSDNLRHKFKYTLRSKTIGLLGNDELLTILKPTASLAGKRIALSFEPETSADREIIVSYVNREIQNNLLDESDLTRELPGYLINLKAEFSINGEQIQASSVGKMGTELHEELGLWSPSHGWNTSVNYPTSGGYRAIALNLQGISFSNTEELSKDLSRTRTVIQNQDEEQIAALTKHQTVGDLLFATIQSYFVVNDKLDDVMAESMGVIHYRLPSYGIFSTGLSPQYWFGLPRNVVFSGLSMDVDHMATQQVSKNNDRQETINFNKSIGPRMSALEHLVPEAMFSNDKVKAQGVSAVKALAIAAQQGQKVWTINKDNLGIALDSIQLNSESEVDIRNAVLAGKTVTAHEKTIVYNGWAGEGYIIMDPDTGAGAYIISGGSNGGLLVGVGVLFLILALLNPGTVIAIAGLLFGTLAVGCGLSSIYGNGTFFNVAMWTVSILFGWIAKVAVSGGAILTSIITGLDLGLILINASGECAEL